MNCLPPIFMLGGSYIQGKNYFPKSFIQLSPSFPDRSTPSIVFEAGGNLITNRCFPALPASIRRAAFLRYSS